MKAHGHVTSYLFLIFFRFKNTGSKYTVKFTVKKKFLVILYTREFFVYSSVLISSSTSCFFSSDIHYAKSSHESLLPVNFLKLFPTFIHM